MIAGACLSCGRIEQLFRKDAAFCQRCGKQLTRITVFPTDTGPVVKLADDPRDEG